MASSTPDNLHNTIIGAFALLGLAVVAGAGHSMLRPVQLTLKPLRPAQTSPVEPAMSDPESPGSAVPPVETTEPAGTEHDGHLNLAQARALFNQGEAVFIDARRLDEYEQTHILGAYHLSTESISDGSGRAVLDELFAFGYDYPFILYCHGGDCDASVNTAIRLQQLGYTNLTIMGAGFDEWVNAGYEVEP